MEIPDCKVIITTTSACVPYWKQFHLLLVPGPLTSDREKHRIQEFLKKEKNSQSGALEVIVRPEILLSFDSIYLNIIY